MVEKDFNIARCPICNRKSYENPIEQNKGIMIKNIEFERLKGIGMDEKGIGLLICIRRFDASCNDNYNLPLHVKQLNEILQSLPLSAWDFRQIWLKEHNMTTKDLKEDHEVD